MGRQEGVLIIGDNKEIVRSLKAILGQKYNVLTAYDGLGGLKVLKEHLNSIDIVISDLVMPELSGTVVISHIKKRYPGVPIIAITGWIDEMGVTGSKVKPDRFF